MKPLASGSRATYCVAFIRPPENGASLLCCLIDSAEHAAAQQERGLHGHLHHIESVRKTLRWRRDGHTSPCRCAEMSHILDGKIGSRTEFFSDYPRKKPTQGCLMRIKVHCQNRVGILRDILNLLVDYGINVNRGEVGGDQGNAIYLLCPNMVNLQLQSLRPKLEAIPGVFGVKRVGLMPSERRHLELNALLGALDFPVLSIDMG